MLNVNILNGGNVSQASGGSSANQLGIINVAADFPTTSEANASIGQGYYLIGANVTDNDPTKTNTGDSFTEGQQIFWSGSAWIVGSFELPIASPTVLGGIKVGDNLTIDPDGTLNATGGGGIASVVAGTNINVDNVDPENPVINLNKQIGLITETFNSPAFNITSTAAVSENPNTATQQSQATTTDDTPTFLTFVSLPISSSCVKITADILAVRTGGADGNPVDTFATTIVGTFKNIAGTITQVGTTDVIGEVSDIIGATAEFVIDGLNVRVVVTGVVDYNITWNANEVKFSTIQL